MHAWSLLEIADDGLEVLTAVEIHFIIIACGVCSVSFQAQTIMQSAYTNKIVFNAHMCIVIVSVMLIPDLNRFLPLTDFGKE